MDTEALGPTVRRLRLAADLTLERLSELSGVSDRALSDIERGAARGPQHRTMLAVVDALGLDERDRAAVLRAAREGRRRARPEPGWRLPLPRGTADFTGRAAELDRVTRALRAVPDAPPPVVVVTGPPGYGKTSLAVRAAQRLQAEFDDQLFLELAGTSPDTVSPGTVVARLVQALVGTGPRGSDDPSRLRALLAGRRVLVVLDDAHDEAQVRAALPTAGPAAVLVTSRRHLEGLEDVVRVDLERLPSGDSRALLARIVPEQQASEADLARLAALCDDVPLALRIAANRLASRATWTVDALASRLAVADRRLDALAAGDLSVRAAIDLSFDQLGPAAQRLFRRLALADGRDVGAGLAATLAQGPVWTTEELLDELVSLSLVRPAEHDRYAMHDLLRLYAQRALAEAEPAEVRADVRGRADAWLLRTTVRAGRWFEPDVLGEGSADLADVVGLRSVEEARTWLTDEAASWLAAFTRAARDGDHGSVVEVAEALHWFSDLWPYWGHWHEVYGASAAAAAALGDDGLLSTHLGYLAWALVHCQGDVVAGAAAADRGLAAAERVGDPGLRAWAAYYVGWCESAAGDHARSVETSEQAIALFRRADDREGLPQALFQRSQGLAALGRGEEAIAHLRDVVALVRDPRTAPRGQVAEFTALHALGTIARISLDRQDWATTRSVADEAITGFLAQDARPSAAHMHVFRAHARRAEDDHAGARADLARAVELFEGSGDVEGLAAAQAAGALVTVGDDAGPRRRDDGGRTGRRVRRRRRPRR
ncbi:ATP-binding protein [Cellulosimicrobium protaetiae]|uniref:Helix-turn-helix domain-containing protein n=1 Tax=Cellulosimicrobium protaetiae TaxID=2587808 RepID=A0A6M5UI15_9MICO|nr:helix-turn-helix domain-containing protein [Cellulosimicrobium protaetiae]QJW36758.1 helix-turn-helix domain-containing protein [Cellulosimicrobium protaetiae]